MLTIQIYSKHPSNLHLETGSQYKLPGKTWTTSTTQEWHVLMIFLEYRIILIIKKTQFILQYFCESVLAESLTQQNAITCLLCILLNAPPMCSSHFVLKQTVPSCNPCPSGRTPWSSHLCSGDWRTEYDHRTVTEQMGNSKNYTSEQGTSLGKWHLYWRPKWPGKGSHANNYEGISRKRGKSMSHEGKEKWSRKWQEKWIRDKDRERDGWTHHCILEGLRRGLGFVLNVKRQPDLKKWLPGSKKREEGIWWVKRMVQCTSRRQTELREDQERWYLLVTGVISIHLQDGFTLRGQGCH